MKKIIFSSLILALSFTSCKNQENSTVIAQETVETKTIDVSKFADFGEKFELKDLKSKSDIAAIYANMKEGDTLALQFESEIQATCKKKGCWMSLDLGNEEKAIVRFKDYGFFVPKEGAEGKTSIVNGKAFLSVTSVDQLKHDAKDGGKSQAAIDSIVAPRIQKMFLADGVLISK